MGHNDHIFNNLRYCVAMSVLSKIKEFVKPSTSEMFDAYLKYFQEHGKSLKIGRGSIKIVYDNITEEYPSWIELNERYKLFPTLVDKVNELLQPVLFEKGWHISSNMFGDVVVVCGDKKVAIYRNKFDLAYELGLNKFDVPRSYKQCHSIDRIYRMYTYGSTTDSDTIAKKFNAETGSNSFIGKMFRCPERLYYINSWGHLCSTKDSMVIDIIENDDCWYNIMENENKDN